MAYTPREIKDRVAVGDDIFVIENLGDNRIKLIPAPTHVSEPGTPVNKALLQPIEDYLATGVVPVERTITAGNGLTGGGDLSADRTLSVDFTKVVPVQRTITAGNGLTGGGSLTTNRTLSLGTPSTLSGATSNSVTSTSHTHAISVATKAEAEGGTNNVKLMTPLRVAEAFNSRVVFAQVNGVTSDATVTRVASSLTDYNTIHFTTLLQAGENNKQFSVTFPSLGDVVVGTPQYLLSESPTLSSSEMLEFRCYSPRYISLFGNISINHGISSFGRNRVEFALIRVSSEMEDVNNVYLHFRFTGLKLA